MSSPQSRYIGPEACAEPLEYERADFGLSVGRLATTGKLHIFAGINTSHYLINLMNRQETLPYVDHDLIFPGPSHHPHDEFAEESYVAELKRGRRIVRALTNAAAIRGSEDTAVDLLKMMDAGARRIVPYLPELPYDAGVAVRDNVRNVWLNTKVYNAICPRGISAPELAPLLV